MLLSFYYFIAAFGVKKFVYRTLINGVNNVCVKNLPTLISIECIVHGGKVKEVKR